MRPSSASIEPRVSLASAAGLSNLLRRGSSIAGITRRLGLALAWGVVVVLDAAPAAAGASAGAPATASAGAPATAPTGAPATAPTGADEAAAPSTGGASTAGVSPASSPVAASEAPTATSGAPAASGAPRSADDARAARPEARTGFGGELRVAGSVHRPGFAVALIGDYAWRRAAVGVGVEVNPYFGVGPGDLVAGALHVFATAEHRVPIGRVTLRQRLAVGPAILLAGFDAYARGSVGIFLEGAPISLEIQTRVKRIAVTFDAFSLALSAPALRPADGGDPLVRYQYRAAIGVRF